ncbi:MAG: MucR family transcriptional regulator [Rhodospirillales bacterium]|jgi:predicted transcriptional regulator|nr:MucR family transcriptional regulator [Rhodospirillales bacterium]
MTENTNESIAREDILRMAVDIVAAYVSRNQVGAPQIPEVIKTIIDSLRHVQSVSHEVSGVALKPKVPIRRSITPDFIICLEDGKKLKMLKRHLRTAYNLTPEEYRAKWKLGPDYPMVAPNYAKQRSEFAKKIGLGRKRGPRKAKR